MARQRKKDLEASASPPTVPPVNADGVPDLLRQSDQWVIWKYERRTDNRGSARWTKVPIKVSSRVMASATDPETWCGFGDALAVYRRTRDVHAGVGFVFHRDDPFCGIDLDDCRDPATGDIAQWAADIITALNSYTEISPSGTGVKIIIQGFVPGGRNRVKYEGGEFECYDCARFFVITGNVVEPPGLPGLSASINDAQAAFEEIYARVFANVEHEPVSAAASSGAPPAITNVSDSQLLDRIFSSSVGDGFRRLWYGDTSQCEGDSSRADFQLCRLLAWWCHGDECRIDALFRQSGLMRPKWGESRGGGTYGEKTIRFAVRTLRTYYDPAYRRAGESTPAVTPATQGNSGSATPTPASTPTSPPHPQEASNPNPGACYRLANYIMLPTITSDNRQLFAPRGLSAPEIATAMRAATDNWPRRVGDRLFVPHPERRVHWLEDSNSLFSWASAALAAAGGMGNPIQWGGRGDDMLTKAEYYRHLVATSAAYDGVEFYPHEPLRPGLYYADYPQAGGDGRALCDFLDFFSPSTDLDRELILSVLLTACWGGDPGNRPMFAFVAEEGDIARGRGTGKTTTAQQIAEVWEGFVKVRINDDFTEVQKRLLSAGAAHKRFILIDNIRESKLSVADLEDLITSNWISGREMYVGEGRRQNLLTVMATYNDMQMSLDLAQRSVIIHLSRPKVTGDWSKRIAAFIRDRRPELIGDLVARLRQPRKQYAHASRRWGLWEDEVLSRVDKHNECQQLMYQRQGQTDGDAEQMELVREEFTMVLRRNEYNPSTAVVFFTTSQAITIAARAKLGRFALCDNPTRLGRMGVPELRKHRRSHCRGFIWVGSGTTWENDGTVKLKTFVPTYKIDEDLVIPDGVSLLDDDDDDTDRNVFPV